MKIKLAILDKDKSYLNRIVTVFEVKYADKFEVYSFTDLSVAIQTLSEVKIGEGEDKTEDGKEQHFPPGPDEG